MLTNLQASVSSLSVTWMDYWHLCSYTVALRLLAVTQPALCTSHNLHLTCSLVASFRFLLSTSVTLYDAFTFSAAASSSSYDSFVFVDSNSDVIVGGSCTLCETDIKGSLNL